MLTEREGIEPSDESVELLVERTEGSTGRPVKAKNPSVGEGHVGSGAAIGGLTGVFVGLIGGPLGLLLWARSAH